VGLDREEDSACAGPEALEDEAIPGSYGLAQTYHGRKGVEQAIAMAGEMEKRPEPCKEVPKIQTWREAIGWPVRQMPNCAYCHFEPPIRFCSCVSFGYNKNWPLPMTWRIS